VSYYFTPSYALYGGLCGGISKGKLLCGPRLQHGELEAASGEEVTRRLPPDATRVIIARTLIVWRAHAHCEPTWPADEHEGVEAVVLPVVCPVSV
jgi:hypothetical protein